MQEDVLQFIVVLGLGLWLLVKSRSATGGKKVALGLGAALLLLTPIAHSLVFIIVLASEYGVISTNSTLAVGLLVVLVWLLSNRGSK